MPHRILKIENCIMYTLTSTYTLETNYFNIRQFLYFSFSFCRNLYNIHTLGSVLRLHMIQY